MAETEADHFGNCPVCGAYRDMRDLGQMLAHDTINKFRSAKGRNRPKWLVKIMSRDMKEAATRG